MSEGRNLIGIETHLAPERAASGRNHGLGRMMTGGQDHTRDSRNRPECDLYPTPEEATEALLCWLRSHSLLVDDTPVWEPACGDGAIARVLEAHNHPVYATDLYDHGYGETGVDFMTAGIPEWEIPIITNPPYGHGLPAAFIWRALAQLRTPLLCLLLKSTYWHAAKGIHDDPPRDLLWRVHRPSAVLALTWRLDFFGLGNPTMECSWNVWSTAHEGTPTVYDRLDKPVPPEPLPLFATIDDS